MGSAGIKGKEIQKGFVICYKLGCYCLHLCCYFLMSSTSCMRAFFTNTLVEILPAGIFIHSLFLCFRPWLFLVCRICRHLNHTRSIKSQSRCVDLSSHLIHIERVFAYYEHMNLIMGTLRNDANYAHFLRVTRHNRNGASRYGLQVIALSPPP